MKINLYGPICFTGYGVATTNILKALAEQGHEVSLWPIGNISAHEENGPLLEQCLKSGQLAYDKNAPCIKIWHQHDLHFMVGKGEHIGFPIYELNRFRPEELYSLANVDRLFVCSHWAKQIMDEQLSHAMVSNIPKVEVVPLGYDPLVFYPTDTPSGLDDYIFLNIGKWEIRKGHDILVKAFNEAFTPEDKVQLWMLPHNPFLSEQQTQEWMRMYKTSKLGEKIQIYGPCPSQYHVAGLMRQADCGVFPARAEGWNLELLEMMACGKRCITTNYSAHTEFCGPNNVDMIDIDRNESAYDGIWFHSQGEWAELGQKQIDQLVEYMRSMYKNRPKTDLYTLEQVKKFTWKNSAKIISNLLNC